MQSHKKKWAFIIHPRDREDMEEKFWFAHLLPTSWLKWIGKKMRPSVVSHVYYNDTEGWLVGTYAFPQLLNKNDVLTACVFAVEKLGVEVIGLGALTAPITAGGKWLLKRMPPNVTITNGNSLTAAMVFEGIQKAATLKGWHLDNDIEVAILGATGSVGSGVSQLLIMTKQNNPWAKLTPPSSRWRRIEKRLWKLSLKDLKKIHQIFGIEFDAPEEELTKEDYILVLQHDAEEEKLERVVREIERETQDLTPLNH